MGNYNFGFSNNIKDLESVHIFREAAIKDGWILEPVYEVEPPDSYGKLKKDGFVMQICARDTERSKQWYPKTSSKWKYECGISIWSPAGLGIETPYVYSWEEIFKNICKCYNCGEFVDEVFQVAFCNKSCRKCLPAMKEKMEFPGWCE